MSFLDDYLYNSDKGRLITPILQIDVDIVGQGQGHYPKLSSACIWLSANDQYLGVH